jgi:hypothetical protein
MNKVSSISFKGAKNIGVVYNPDLKDENIHHMHILMQVTDDNVPDLTKLEEYLKKNKFPSLKENHLQLSLMSSPALPEEPQNSPRIKKFAINGKAIDNIDAKSAPMLGYILDFINKTQKNLPSLAFPPGKYFASKEFHQNYNIQTSSLPEYMDCLKQIFDKDMVNKSFEKIKKLIEERLEIYIKY